MGNQKLFKKKKRASFFCECIIRSQEAFEASKKFGAVHRVGISNKEVKAFLKGTSYFRKHF